MTQTLPQAKYKILSGSVLKLLAVITMTIDHSAVVLYPVIAAIRASVPFFGRTTTVYMIMRMIGRLAFPIFCFLVAEGYQHTRNKWKYALRLLFFAIASEIPFNMMCKGTLWTSDYQNVYFTLFMGLAMIYAFENIGKRLLQLVTLAGICLVALYFHADYGLNGALLVFMIYVLRNTPIVQPIIAYPLLSGEIHAILAFLPINLYNGKRGFIRFTWLKWLFYIFYPLHITILVGIKHIILHA